ncbi:MAG: FkbM family methyltransferase [Chloroflexaceae bacterium]|nr:FkbM family methyltransferase [Chloroflexaceae bacterium]
MHSSGSCCRRCLQFCLRSPNGGLGYWHEYGAGEFVFASNPRVQAVYGYEPFRPTYQQALRNFALNPDLSPKIKPFAYGIGATEQVLNLEYSYENKGSIGLYGETTHHYQSQSPKRIEEIAIKPAIAIFDSIRAAHPDASLVAKIDCEGAEYEILTALQVSGRLSDITAIMMEWHCQGPEAIETCLREAGLEPSMQPVFIRLSNNFH